MKRQYLFAVIIICLFLICGCQPTPEKPIVVSKGDDKLQEAIYGTPAPVMSEPYAAPNAWKEAVACNSGVDIDIDADVFVPNALNYPVYRVIPKEISEEEAKSFVAAFFSEEELYTVESWQTKDLIMQKILRLQGEIASLSELVKNGDITQDMADNDKLQYEQKIAVLQEEYKAAPTEIIATLRESKFMRTLLSSNPDVYVSSICGATKDAKRYISVCKDENSDNGYACMQTKYYIANYKINGNNLLTGEVSVDWSDNCTNLKDMTLTLDEAKQIADKIVFDTLGYDDYLLATVASERYIPYEYDFHEWMDYQISHGGDTRDEPQRYVLIYTKSFNGIQLMYHTTALSSLPQYNARWAQNCLAVTVDESGVYSVYEQSSIQTKSELTSNVPLLAFEKIQDRIRDSLPNVADMYYAQFSQEGNIDPNQQDKPQSNELRISSINLGYARVTEKDASFNVCDTIPAWFCYGQYVSAYASEDDCYHILDERLEWTHGSAGNVLLCINAIDGSIIDLSQGY